MADLLSNRTFCSDDLMNVRKAGDRSKCLDYYLPALRIVKAFICTPIDRCDIPDRLSNDIVVDLGFNGLSQWRFVIVQTFTLSHSGPFWIKKGAKIFLEGFSTIFEDFSQLIIVLASSECWKCENHIQISSEKEWIVPIFVFKWSTVPCESNIEDNQ